MLTTSLEFALFLPIVFVLYWFVLKNSLKLQNALILVASYVFYGWWDWRFLVLIAISSAVDYVVGIFLNTTSTKSKRNALLGISLLVNLGMLGFFKYYNFFLDSFVDAFTLFGFSLSPDRLQIILPVGISFYTLQTLSYTIDVYDRKLKGTKDFLAFFAYVSFFPQLVAGPIERATQLLPQFQQKRTFDYTKASDGMRQILWGLFKKIVVADNLAVYTYTISMNYQDHSASTLLMCLVMFSFQFYCDFSGYSDIAIGTGRLFGFNLMKNFDYPIFARSIPELWQKWHISLFTWFRDYIVRRLKGFRKWQVARNILIIFLVTGLWHGAAWTYLTWGLLHSLLFMQFIFLGRKKFKTPVAAGKLLPSLGEFGLMVKTFMSFTLLALFFFIQPLSKCFSYLGSMIDWSIFAVPLLPENRALAGIGLLLVIEWLQREKEHGLELSGSPIPKMVRWGVYYGLLFAVFYYGGQPQDFLYFQF
ncbi:MBOAT family protein [Echinicola strongylocentroti]|uniref:MBOAT family protein n=1 Tax=Echinicola strongylocentroti TaxID=1795355 RepID=A0A2Z4II67_9BACT|nr:MBOAT family O-acyltransferase [Echinicola strongylocentroti]AWW30812.1 MBOAT family protein [Echinicola strongylocentroti]